MSRITLSKVDAITANPRWNSTGRWGAAAHYGSKPLQNFWRKSERPETHTACVETVKAASVRDKGCEPPCTLEPPNPQTIKATPKVSQK